MTTSVETSCTLPLEDHLKIGRAPSVTRIAHPFAVALNHILGHLGGGLRHLQRAFSAPTTAGTARVRTFRHPNIAHVDVLVEVGARINDQTGWSIAVTAGGGDTQTVSSSSPTEDAEGPGVWRIRAPWDAADADEQDITIVATNVPIQATAVVDVPREFLSYADGDLCIERVDGDYPAIALLPERAIAASPEAGPGAIAARTDDAWESYRPQHMSWWEYEADALEFTASSFGGAGSASDMFPSLTLRFRARKKKAGDTRTTVSFWVRCKTSGAAVGGQIKASASNPGPGADDSDSLGFSGVSYTWRELSVEVDCTAEATITLEAINTSGGTTYITGVAAIGSA